MPARKRSISILVNTASNYLYQVLRIGIFLLLTPYIAIRIGTEGYGLWSLIQSTVGIFGLCDLGFSNSVVKYIADARGKDDKERLASLCSTFFWVYSAIGLLVMTLSLLFATVLPDVLSIPSEKHSAAVVVFVIIALRAATSMPLGMFRGVMTGFQKQWWSNLLRIADTALYGMFAFWALYYEPSIERLAVASMTSHLFAMLGGFALCMAKLPDISIRPSRFDRSLLKEVSSFSMYFFMIQISTLIYSRIDAIIIQTWLSLSAVALYNVAARAAEHSSGLCRQLTNALTPVVAELKGANDEKNIKAVFRLGTKLSTALAVPVILGLFVLVEPTLVAWMGEEFSHAVPACRLLLIASLISVFHGNAANILAMTGHQRYLAFVFLGSQITNLTLTILLVSTYGITGVALATLVSSSLADIFFVQRKASKSTKIPQIQFYFETLLPAIIPAIIMIFAMHLLMVYIPPGSLINIALIEALACIVFIVAYYFLGLSGKERLYLIQKLSSALSKKRSNDCN